MPSGLLHGGGVGFTKSLTTPCSGCAARTGCAETSMRTATNGLSQRCMSSSPATCVGRAILPRRGDRRRLSDQREHPLREPVHLFALRATLEEHQAEADALEHADPVPDLLAVPDPPGPHPAVPHAAVVERDLRT